MLNEIDVNDTRASVRQSQIVGLDHPFADADDCRSVSADPNLMVLRTDARTARDHLNGALRIDETLQPTFTKRVEGHDRHAALGSLLQRVQHAWRVRGGVVAEEKDAISVLEVLQQHRADRRADHLRQRHRRRLVAHVGAVGEIVRAVHATEQLVHVARFQRGAAGRVHDDSAGIELVQFEADLAECLAPIDRHIFVAGRIVAHRMAQPSLLLQLVIRPVPQLGECMLREELRRDGFACYFPGGRFGTILAELEQMRACRLGPGATHAHEPAGLVLLQQDLTTEDRDLFLGENVHYGIERAPATSRRIIGFDFCFLPHRRPSIASPPRETGGGVTGSSATGTLHQLARRYVVAGRTSCTTPTSRSAIARTNRQ